MIRDLLTDEQWECISDIFPARAKTGRPPTDRRLIVDGILWVLRTGAAWRDTPKEFGPWETVYGCFDRWNDDGTLDKILQRLRSAHVDVGAIDEDLWCIDGTIVRAHRCARWRWEKNDPEEPTDHALGRSRGGFSTKIHLLCDANGHPLHFLLTPGQAHESTALEELLSGADADVRDSNGGPIAWPVAIAGDKGYRADWIDEYLLCLAIIPVIPSKDNEDRSERPVEFDRDAYRDRNIIERLIGWLKESRRIFSRFEKTAKNFGGMIKLAFIQRYFRLMGL